MSDNNLCFDEEVLGLGGPGSTNIQWFPDSDCFDTQPQQTYQVSQASAIANTGADDLALTNTPSPPHNASFQQHNKLTWSPNADTSNAVAGLQQTPSIQPITAPDADRPDKPWICLQCDEPFSLSRKLEEHAQVEEHKAYRCTFPGCEHVFQSRPSCSRHIKSHNTSFSCARPGCPKAFARKDHLAEHVRLVHRNTIDNHIPGNAHGTPSVTQEGPGSSVPLPGKKRKRHENSQRAHCHTTTRSCTRDLIPGSAPCPTRTVTIPDLDLQRLDVEDFSRYKLDPAFVHMSMLSANPMLFGMIRHLVHLDSMLFSTASPGGLDQASRMELDIPSLLHYGLLLLSNFICQNGYRNLQQLCNGFERYVGFFCHNMRLNLPSTVGSIIGQTLAFSQRTLHAQLDQETLALGSGTGKSYMRIATSEGLTRWLEEGLAKPFMLRAWEHSSHCTYLFPVLDFMTFVFLQRPRTPSSGGVVPHPLFIA